MKRASIVFVLGFLGIATAARAARLKELCDVEGVRSNPLIGIGLVVGLAGTGDDASSPVVRKQLAAMSKRLGVTIDPTEIKSKNVAVVVVTAELPPFARAGSAIDVTVSSSGSAKSLQGGTLLMTPLKGADLGTYAVAQGSLTLGGFAAEGRSGSATKKNHATVARIPGGASVEQDAPGALPRDAIVLVLKQPDFTTASRISGAIDEALGTGSARVRDPGAVTVAVGGEWRGRVVELVARLEALQVARDVEARVIIDERTGTIVAGANVSIGPVAIAYGGLTIEIAEASDAVQAAPLTDGATVVTPRSEVRATEQEGAIHALPAASTVGDVAAALNALGVKPRDLPAIFQALHDAGALDAEIQVK